MSQDAKSALITQSVGYRNIIFLLTLDLTQVGAYKTCLT